MYCPICGFDIPEGEDICPNCHQYKVPKKLDEPPKPPRNAQNTRKLLEAVFTVSCLGASALVFFFGPDAMGSSHRYQQAAVSPASSYEEDYVWSDVKTVPEENLKETEPAADSAEEWASVPISTNKPTPIPTATLKPTSTPTPVPTATPVPNTAADDWGAEYPVSGADGTINVIGGIEAPAADFEIPDSSTRLLTDDDFAFLYDESPRRQYIDSQMMIDDIFARYGFSWENMLDNSFCNKIAQEHFDSCDWYQEAKRYCPVGSSRDDSQVLLHNYMNSIEQENVARIVEWQDEYVDYDGSNG